MDAMPTWDGVARWLPADIRHELTLALPPRLRGWYTHEEAEADGGRFVELRTAERAESWLMRVGDR